MIYIEIIAYYYINPNVLTNTASIIKHYDTIFTTSKGGREKVSCVGR